MNRQEFLEIVERSWQQLDAAIDGIDDATMEEPGVVGGWSLREILGHVSTWEQVALRYAEQWRNGQTIDGLGGLSTDDFNAQEAARRHEWPLAQVRAEVGETRERLRVLVQSLTDDDWNTIIGDGDDQGPFGDWLEGALNGSLGPGTHAAEHAEQIKAWRAARNARS